MKRLITLSLALVFVFAIAATTLMPGNAEAIDAKLMGSCEGLCVESGVIKQVLVLVKGGWTNTDVIELDIEITGANGSPNIWHGRQVVPVSSTTVYSTSKDVVRVSVDWDDKATELHPFEVFTVDTQVLINGKPLGIRFTHDFVPGTYGSCL